MKLLKRPVVLFVLGFTLFALFVWIAGPLFAFGGYEPLQSITARLVFIGVVIAGWGAWRLLKAVRAKRASDKLIAAVAKQPDSRADRPSGEALQLREKFEEGVARLTQQQRRGHGLYDRPWYVIIGAPGSGKTTALVKSGLHFPAEQRSGRGALPGVGGTRNCDWWFSDEAVLLDTAGRYTLQDSDAAADGAAWAEFLALLKKHRPRRPVNGVILAISARDLIAQGKVGRDGHVAAARRRLDELNRELRVQLPVYVIVTMCDLVAGFTEYFDNLLTRESRAEVWGVTFPYDRTLDGDAAKTFGAEFDALMMRLNERVFARLDEEREVTRRTKVFGFPQQMAALRETLTEFVLDVFASTRFDKQVLLRGVYFTSGTQEGTPFERLMGAMVRRMSLAPEAVTTAPGGGKAYFIENLLKDVIIGESGLAGINRRLEMQKAAAQLGIYAATVTLAAVGLVVLFWSFNLNRLYVAEVAAAVQQLPQAPGPGPAASLASLVPRLDALQGVEESAALYQRDVPLRMRWGLYQGNSLSNAAHDAYVRELKVALLPRLAAAFGRRLNDYGGQPEELYFYLKAYLMLEQPTRLDPVQVGLLADREWKTEYAAQPEIAAALSRHFATLLKDPAALPPTPIDTNLVARARTPIRLASIPRLVYRDLKFNRADNKARDVRLDVAAGIGAEQVFRRRSGPLSVPVPAFYTAPVFHNVIATEIGEVAQQFADEHWVWGEGGQPPVAPATLAREVATIYENDYIATWDAVLKDIELVSVSGTAGMAQLLGKLAGGSSPLRGLLETVDANTYLVKPAEPPPSEDALSKARKAAAEKFNKLFGDKDVSAPQTAPPGSRITAHFDPIHQLVAGEPGRAPIDRVLELMGQLGAQLSGVGAGQVGGKSAVADPGAANAVLRSLKAEADVLPAPVGSLVSAVHDRSSGAIRGGIRDDLFNRYQQEVVNACREVVNDNYPFFVGSATDAPPDDVARLFGRGGVFDRFFESNLVPLVDTTRAPWRWRTDIAGAAVGGSPAMLRQFEASQRIRDILFPSGSQSPALQFTVVPTYLDQDALRFVLEIDGQPVEYRHGPTAAKRLTWPGPSPGSAHVSFEDRSSKQANREFKGHWAWFRLLDSAQTRTDTVTRHQVTFQMGGHEARVAIEAQSVRNPFASRELQQFRCEI